LLRREHRPVPLGCEQVVCSLLSLTLAIGFLSLDFNGILLVIVLEGQLTTSRHEVEEARHR
jgi:hypothetical protein